MRGLTLIETMLYLALLTLLLASAIGIAASFQSASQPQDDAIAASEDGAFIIAKLGWALSVSSAVSASADGRSLTFRTLAADGVDDPIVIAYDASAGRITLSAAEEPAEPLSGERASAFAATAGPVGAATVVSAGFVLDDMPFLFERIAP